MSSTLSRYAPRHRNRRSVRGTSVSDLGEAWAYSYSLPYLYGIDTEHRYLVDAVDGVVVCMKCEQFVLSGVVAHDLLHSAWLDRVVAI